MLKSGLSQSAPYLQNRWMGFNQTHTDTEINRLGFGSQGHMRSKEENNASDFSNLDLFSRSQ